MNVLEFVFLVDILLLQMIKSTNDIQVSSVLTGLHVAKFFVCIQTADFLDVIEYHRGCGRAIKVEQNLHSY